MNHKKLGIFFYGILMMSAVTCTNQQSANAPAVNTTGIVGTWELISRTDKTGNDSTVNEPTLGSDPIALLMYDAFGNMSVQLMKRNRSDSITTNLNRNTNNSNVFNGYDAYFGKYSIDSIKSEINHHVKGTIYQADIGKVLIRKYNLSQDTLILSFSTNNNDIPVTRTLTWVRIEN